jgi:DNA topoisomerase-1
MTSDTPTPTLHFSSDEEPGITRHRCGKGFTYRTPAGETLRDPDDRSRIEDIVIPPAWTDVWICTSPLGHLQATGRDAKQRKQYRYHPAYRRQREQKKFDHLLAFGDKLPQLRRAIDQDMHSPNMSATRVTAAAVRLIDLAGLRVGNERYRREHQTFGLTTIRDKHVELTRSKVNLDYTGKSGKPQQVEVDAPRVARVLRRCSDLPGQALWTYESNGQTYRLTSDRINTYIQTHGDEKATAKTFRIWLGSTIALGYLLDQPDASSKRQRKRQFLDAVDAAREQLNNTRAVCRASYLHPAIEAMHTDRTLHDTVNYATCRSSSWLSREEAALKRLLKHI